MTGSHAIETQSLTLRYGNFTAVDAVSLKVPNGARHAIIGPNGAGKTSFVSALTGSVRATSGGVLLGGQDVSRLSQAQRVRQGLARTFQINQLFTGLTVLQNIQMALIEQEGLSQVFWRAIPSRGHLADEARALLALVQLESFESTPVASLAYGQRRLVEIAIALATRPKVLILDEPAAGVPAAQSELIFERISALPKDMTLLFIEHDMNLVFRFAERISVLVSGSLMTEGTPAEIRADDRVREVYLGRRGHHALA
ncbi:ABC transporter ATP-binding protein [Variovorax sp. Sphag1AA]|uniref:ABC transporter ATP-binding protein n=1 Tax=Variovorax sp. Sphag1AA TaxID=2587027 RepID=UPI0016165E5A|nr:ABC transporter ATP-binding protein [Variovorax sp. Sphag1AA]MBB3178595.1 branched-chain amino acid transport system ATP-binding protein [Variovorax sp. Sphag1AA]